MPTFISESQKTVGLLRSQLLQNVLNWDILSLKERKNVFWKHFKVGEIKYGDRSENKFSREEKVASHKISLRTINSFNFLHLKYSEQESSTT